MDNAVALVQSYLQINGYFTITEYPIIELFGKDQFRMATDIDILSYRFANAGRIVTRRGHGHKKDRVITQLDPVLSDDPTYSEMIIGEVKESRARFNPNMFNPAVLRSALMRFGFCKPQDVSHVVDDLLHDGVVRTEIGQRIQILIFGTEEKTSVKKKNYRIISLKHVLSFLQNYIKEYWPILKNAQFRDPGLSNLITLEKIQKKIIK